MFPVYVINLDRRPDRLAAITAALDRLGMPFERVPATDANDLPSRDLPPTMDMGAVACALSHSEAIRRFLGTPREVALILEDDVELATDVPMLCESVDWWPHGTSCVKLNDPGHRKSVQGWRCGRTPIG